MDALGPRRTGTILKTPVDITSHELTCARVFELARRKKPAYICYATAHMLVEATRRFEVKDAYKCASIVNPDGTPIAWCLRLMGYRNACRVNGPTSTPILLREAETLGTPVGFYGGRPDTLVKMERNLIAEYPALKLVYVHSPPFRELSKAELAQDIAEINASGAQLLFVGLGSPKQEIWMYRNYASLNCVCLGVGAAFEILSGEKVFPPEWVQRLGLTWLVRLCQEPRRLASRNLYSPVFAVMWLAQVGSHVGRSMFGLSSRKRPTAEGRLSE